MRKEPILVGLTLAAVAAGVGVVVAPRLRSEGATRPVDERASIVEAGSLYRFAGEAPGPKKGDEPAASIALTSSDGTGLTLASLDARGVVEGPLAFTEIRLAFDNPDDRTLEGTFRITLPQGAAISRFAMRQGERWQEGEVVEKQAARRAYEDFLHRKQDPALLEQAAGNEFSARVFPIPPRGRKELIVSYSQELTPEAPYVVPLRGLPRVGKLDAAVSRAGDDAPLAGQVHLENEAPRQDLVVEAAKLAPGDGVRAGELALVRVRPAAEAGDDPVASALVMVDTSASRALGFEAQIELLAKVAAGLGAAPLVVAAFDQGVDVVYEGPAAGFAEAGPARLRERQALGASNLEGALTWAKAKVHATRSRRVIVMTDGVPTMGAIDPAALRLAAEALKGAGVERLDALAVGGIRDDAQLKALCAAGLARDGVVIDGAKGAEQALRRLRLATRSVDVKVEGAEWQWPERLEGVQPGDEALVYAKLAPGASPKLMAGGAASEPKLANVDRPLLERAWVSAKIAQLVQKPPPGLSAEAARDEIVRLSTAFRVLSPHTALLVLETEQDYVRYKIDRKALADILAIDGTKLARQRRAEDAPVPAGAPTLKPAPVSDGVVLRAPPPPPGGAQPGGSPGEEGLVAPWGGVDGGIGTLARGSDGSTDTRARGDEGGIGTRARGDEGSIGTLARGDEGGTGARAKGEEGSMGRSATAPAAEAPAAVGSLWGDEIGETFGVGGLGLRGIGEGGGGRSEGIGLGSIGSRQAGAGRGAGSSAGSGRLGGSHATNPVRIRPGAVEVNGRLPPQVIHRIVRQNFGRFRLCYEAALGRTPNLSGQLEVRFVIARDGSVAVASGTGSTLADPPLVACVARSFRELTFPRPEGGIVSVVYPLSFTTGDAAAATPAGGPGSGVESSGLTAPPRPPPPARFGPYQGQLAEVMEALSKGEKAAALQKAVAFRAESPGDVLALVALGEAFEAAGETRSAARAYGSLIDLFASRADLRRMAGERLERLDATYAHALAADSYDKAARQRPDHPSSHRLLAYARLRAGDPAGAFEAIEAGAKRTFPAGRFRGVERILREDAGLIGAAWANQNPAARGAIEQRLRALGAALEQGPSLRFVLNWETDANDVDFHIYDARGGHAFFVQKELPSGGQLYDDVTTGYGPECFTVRAAAGERAGAYRLRAHYYARGPMGYGMGKLEIIDHDGKGNLVFEQRPFVIMRDGAFVELGTYPAGAVVKATEETEGAEGAERPELPRP